MKKFEKYLNDLKIGEGVYITLEIKKNDWLGQAYVSEEELHGVKVDSNNTLDIDGVSDNIQTLEDLKNLQSEGVLKSFYDEHQKVQMDL